MTTRVSPQMLSATGTPSSETYLRGDGVWAPIGPSTPAPSIRPVDWNNDHAVLFRSLQTRAISRVVPKQYLELPAGGHTLLAQARHYNGTSTSWTTMLLFSDDKVNWRESNANPIFDQIEYDWQGERAMGEALVWDHQEEKWALIFSANGESALAGPPYNSQGIRAVGLARSATLERGSWEINPDPIILVEDADILTWYGSGAGRVYCAGAPYWDENDELWYMPVQAGSAAGGQPYMCGIVKAATLDGPWLSIANNPILEGDGGVWEGNQCSANSWVRAGDTWWLAYKGATQAIGLAQRTGHVDGVWTKTPDPIIEPDFTPDRLVLVPGPHGWLIVTSSDDGGDNLVVAWAEKVAAKVLQAAPIVPIAGPSPVGYRDDYYYWPQIGALGNGTATMVANRLYALPITIKFPVRMQALVANVTTAVAGNAVIGLYSTRQEMAYPGDKIFQTTAFSTGATGVAECSCDEIVPPGDYWLVMHVSSTATFRALSASTQMSDLITGTSSSDPTAFTDSQVWVADQTYGAIMPRQFPTGGAQRAVTALPRIGFRAKAIADG